MEDNTNQLLTIGLLTGSLSSNYHEGILQGAHAIAQELGLRLLVFSGGPFHAQNPLVQSRDSLFELADPEQLDAVIIPFSSLTRYMDDQEIQSLIDKYKSIPIINIGTHMEGLINITPNYEQGLSQLMEHFIHDHGYRKIALLRGPKHHASSNLRTAIYCDMLKKHQIPIDNDLIIHTDLERNSTGEFIDLLLASNGSIDAVIAINSNATLTLMDALKKRNICVPKDIAFAGMTNLTDELYTVPTLTLIDENFYNMGELALKAAYNALNEQASNKDIYIDMPLIIGASCGCQPIDMPISDAQLSKTACHLKSLAHCANVTGDYNEFSETLSQYLTAAIEEDNALHLIKDAFNLLHSFNLDKHNPTEGLPLQTMTSFIAMLSHTTTSSIRFHRHETKYYLDFIRDMGNMMNSQYDLGIIEKYILSTMSIHDIFINIYEDCDLTTMRSKNILSISNSSPDPTNQDYFPSNELLPAHKDFIHLATTVLVFPLILRAQHYGNLIVGYDGHIRGSAYEAIETLISTTVKNELQIQDLIDAKSKFDKFASYDSLTGLPNRRLFSEQVNDYILESAGTIQGALITINLDRFKQINDTLGHTIGDQLLRLFSEQLREIMPTDNKIARISGDEFALLLKNIYTETEVHEYIRSVYDHFSQPLFIGSNPLYISLCMGIAIYPNDGLSAELLLGNAARAMHKAKTTGQNQFVYYDPSIEELSQQRHTDELRLREAINQQAFHLDYQPKVDSMTGQMVGLEALVRIIDKDGNKVAPSAFINIAEELGVINQIDEWVLGQVCRDINRLESMNKICPQISVNLSASQLKEPTLVTVYMAILDQYQLSPAKIQIELTEQALIHNKELALNTLHQLSQVGFTIALDDFGTGYSSLSYIRTFPLDTMKIDSSFIANALNNKKDMAVLSTMIHLANQLDLTIVAEGVETKEQYLMVRNFGCHQIQGFYFSQAVAIDTLIFDTM